MRAHHLAACALGGPFRPRPSVSLITKTLPSVRRPQDKLQLERDGPKTWHLGSKEIQGSRKRRRARAARENAAPTNTRRSLWLNIAAQYASQVGRRNLLRALAASPRSFTGNNAYPRRALATHGSRFALQIATEEYLGSIPTILDEPGLGHGGRSPALLCCASGGDVATSNCVATGVMGQACSCRGGAQESCAGLERSSSSGGSVAGPRPTLASRH